MKVDVVPLRAKGVKLATAAVKQARTYQGDLLVTTRLGRNNEQVIVAYLTAGDRHEQVLPVLDHMRLTKVRGDNFVLFGFEEVSTGLRQFQTFPQAWWCRPVRGQTADLADPDEESMEGVMADLYSTREVHREWT